MKMLWSGIAHGAKIRSFQIDHIGLSNGHRLKYRTSEVVRHSRGKTKTLPTMAVLSCSESKSFFPHDASHLVTKELIKRFRRDAKAEQFKQVDYEKWFRFHLNEIHLDMCVTGDQSANEIGFVSSFTCVIVDEQTITFCQLGGTHLYLLRNGQVAHLSEGDLDIVKSSEDHRTCPVIASDPSKPFKNQMMGFGGRGHIQPLLVQFPHKKNDVYGLFTEGVSSHLGGEGFRKRFRRTWTESGLDAQVKRLMKKMAGIGLDRSLASLVIKIM
ncbi:MAG: hypothetical protein MI748_14215 [Opitutales bacterium]|nr:hypothetical protein [Opitutales bacterium]